MAEIKKFVKGEVDFTLPGGAGGGKLKYSKMDDLELVEGENFRFFNLILRVENLSRSTFPIGPDAVLFFSSYGFQYFKDKNNIVFNSYVVNSQKGSKSIGTSMYNNTGNINIVMSTDVVRDYIEDDNAKSNTRIIITGMIIDKE